MEDYLAHIIISAITSVFVYAAIKAYESWVYRQWVKETLTIVSQLFQIGGLFAKVLSGMANVPEMKSEEHISRACSGYKFRAESSPDK
jgi:hypothetical protein